MIKGLDQSQIFSSFFYAVCRISPVAAASMDKRTRHCCILCRVEPRVTPGTPQRPYQNNKHGPDWPRAAPPSRWSWGVAVSRSLSSPLAPTAKHQRLSHSALPGGLRRIWCAVSSHVCLLAWGSNCSTLYPKKYSARLSILIPRCLLHSNHYICILMQNCVFGLTGDVGLFRCL